MIPIVESVKINTEEFESSALINPSGFREYDARWLFPDQINLLGMHIIGKAIATQFIRKNNLSPKIVVGHDYRSYSMSVKNALIIGLLSSGATIYDIGMGITPMGYFARHFLNVPGIAMVTASHNENGWTGVKIGAEHPLTHGPEEMKELREIVFSGKFHSGLGEYKYISNLKKHYIEFLSKKIKLKQKFRIVVATGNGTSGAFAPEVLERIGCDVIKLHCDLDWNFPNYNPNPEDMKMLYSLKKEVKKTGADLGMAFDGDGDRLGIVDENGEELFSDKLGLLIARWLSEKFRHSKFIVDVKSTGLFTNDPQLLKYNADVEYWITGHSYIKRRVHEKGALAGFEKSGHFFFSKPIGEGYDDALLAALKVVEMLDVMGVSLSKLKNSLAKTWQSPTMSPYCSEDEKYKVVDDIKSQYEDIYKNRKTICGIKIKELLTVNGVRVILEDGTWGLIRASSNKPSLVIVVESPVSELQMKDMFSDINKKIKATGKVGEYDQKL